MTQPSPQPASMWIDPPLEPSEVDFLAGFAIRGDIRRVWPGQPNAHCPWRVGEDGERLVLDEELARESAGDVAPWLRFLCTEFLAPSTVDAMHTALAHRLRGGHQVTGVVVVDEVHEITAHRNRISERVLVPEHDAVVLPFGGARRAEIGPSGLGQERCVER